MLEKSEESFLLEYKFFKFLLYALNQVCSQSLKLKYHTFNDKYYLLFSNKINKNT